MERNIADYEKDYSDLVNGFEKYKVVYRRKKILEIIDSYQPKSILEIGCGLEPLFCHIEKEIQSTIVEPSEKFYENAKRLGADNENITCIRGLFEEEANKLADRKYDMVICSGLLQEVTNPVKLINAMKSVCDRETVIHINVANMYSIHRLLGVEMGILSNVFEQSETNKRLQQNTNFDMKRLRAMIEDNGLDILEEGSFFIKPFSHKQMEAMMEQHIIDDNVLDGLYNLAKYMPQFGSEIYVNCRVRNPEC